MKVLIQLFRLSYYFIAASALVAVLSTGIDSAKAEDIQSGKIAGQVVDKSSGEPLIGVNVYLKNTTLGAATDLNGSYRILNVPPGNYELIASMVGYTEIEVRGLSMSGDGIVTMNLAMQIETFGGEEIVVEA